MALYNSPTSPLFQRFFQPVVDAYSRSEKAYDCQELTDLDFLEMGINRCVSAASTGRDFLQHHGDHGRKEVDTSLLCKALQSERRLANLCSVNKLITPLLTARVEDAFASIPELDGFAIYAGDGHYHAVITMMGAAHDEKRESSSGCRTKKLSRAFFDVGCPSSSLGLLPGDKDSSLLPSGIEVGSDHEAAQSEDVFRSFLAPEHAGLLEATTDHRLATGLDHARPDEPSLGPVFSVVGSRGVALKVVDLCLHSIAPGFAPFGMGGKQAVGFGEKACGT